MSRPFQNSQMSSSLMPKSKKNRVRKENRSAKLASLKNEKPVTNNIDNNKINEKEQKQLPEKRPSRKTRDRSPIVIEDIIDGFAFTSFRNVEDLEDFANGVDLSVYDSPCSNSSVASTEIQSDDDSRQSSPVPGSSGMVPRASTPYATVESDLPGSPSSVGTTESFPANSAPSATPLSDLPGTPGRAECIADSRFDHSRNQGSPVNTERSKLSNKVKKDTKGKKTSNRSKTDHHGIIAGKEKKPDPQENGIVETETDQFVNRKCKSESESREDPTQSDHQNQGFVPVNATQTDDQEERMDIASPVMDVLREGDSPPLLQDSKKPFNPSTEGNILKPEPLLLGSSSSTDQTPNNPQHLSVTDSCNNQHREDTTKDLNNPGRMSPKSEINKENRSSDHLLISEKNPQSRELKDQGAQGFKSVEIKEEVVDNYFPKCEAFRENNRLSAYAHRPYENSLPGSKAVKTEPPSCGEYKMAGDDHTRNASLQTAQMKMSHQSSPSMHHGNVKTEPFVGDMNNGGSGQHSNYPAVHKLHLDGSHKPQPATEGQQSVIGKHSHNYWAAEASISRNPRQNVNNLSKSSPGSQTGRSPSDRQQPSPHHNLQRSHSSQQQSQTDVFSRPLHPPPAFNSSRFHSPVPTATHHITTCTVIVSTATPAISSSPKLTSLGILPKSSPSPINHSRPTPSHHSNHHHHHSKSNHPIVSREQPRPIPGLSGVRDTTHQPKPIPGISGTRTPDYNIPPSFDQIGYHGSSSTYRGATSPYFPFRSTATTTAGYSTSNPVPHHQPSYSISSNHSNNYPHNTSSTPTSSLKPTSSHQPGLLHNNNTNINSGSHNIPLTSNNTVQNHLSSRQLSANHSNSTPVSHHLPHHNSSNHHLPQSSRSLTNSNHHQSSHHPTNSNPPPPSHHPIISPLHPHHHHSSSITSAIPFPHHHHPSHHTHHLSSTSSASTSTSSSTSTPSLNSSHSSSSRHTAHISPSHTPTHTFPLPHNNHHHSNHHHHHPSPSSSTVHISPTLPAFPPTPASFGVGPPPSLPPPLPPSGLHQPGATHAAAAAAALGMFAPPLPLAALSSAPVPLPTVPPPFGGLDVLANSDLRERERLLSNAALPPYIRAEMHNHSHQHVHQHNHNHTHLPGQAGINPLTSPTLLTPSLSHLYDKLTNKLDSPFPFSSPSAVPSLPGYPSLGALSGLPSVVPPSSLGSGLQGAFQPKNLASSSSIHPSQMLLSLRDKSLPPVANTSPASATAATQPPTTPSSAKKPGKWCAAHVRIAWEIHMHQQKQEVEGSRGVEGPSVAPPSHLLHPPPPPSSGLHRPELASSLLGAGSHDRSSLDPSHPSHQAASLLNPARLAGLSPFPRPSPYSLPPSLGGAAAAFGAFSSLMPNALGYPSSAHDALSLAANHHEWNRLHRTPPSFPQPPSSAYAKSETEARDRETEMIRQHHHQQQQQREGSREREARDALLLRQQRGEEGSREREAIHRDRELREKERERDYILPRHSPLRDHPSTRTSLDGHPASRSSLESLERLRDKERAERNSRDSFTERSRSRSPVRNGPLHSLTESVNLSKLDPSPLSSHHSNSTPVLLPSNSSSKAKEDRKDDVMIIEDRGGSLANGYNKQDSKLLLGSTSSGSTSSSKGPASTDHYYPAVSLASPLDRARFFPPPYGPLWNYDIERQRLDLQREFEKQKENMFSRFTSAEREKLIEYERQKGILQHMRGAADTAGLHHSTSNSSSSSALMHHSNPPQQQHRHNNSPLTNNHSHHHHHHHHNSKTTGISPPNTTTTAGIPPPPLIPTCNSSSNNNHSSSNTSNNSTAVHSLSNSPVVVNKSKPGSPTVPSNIPHSIESKELVKSLTSAAAAASATSLVNGIESEGGAR